MYFEIGAIVAVLNVVMVFVMMLLQTGPAKLLHTRIVLEKQMTVRKFWVILLTSALVSIPITMLVWPVTVLMRIGQAVVYIYRQFKKCPDEK